MRWGTKATRGSHPDPPAQRALRFGELLGSHAQVLDLLDRAAALRGLAKRVREECGVHIGLAGLAESEDLLVLRQWDGLWQGDGMPGSTLHDLHVPIGLGLGGRVYERLEPVWVDDYRRSDVITHDFDVPISADDVRSMMAVPMMLDGRTQGVLYAAMREPVGFSDRQLDTALEIAGTGALALQTASAAERQRQNAVSAERRKMASELHDSVGAQLFRMGAELRDLRNSVGGEAADLLARLDSLQDQLAETASTFRESVHALDHDEPPAGRLAAALTRDCAEFGKRTGISAQSVEIGPVADCDAERGRVLLAVAREALLNVEKHSSASSVLISSVALDGGLAVSVADDGDGASVRDSDGIGLRSAADRVGSLGGTLSTVVNEDGGLTVRVWMPRP